MYGKEYNEEKGIFGGLELGGGLIVPSLMPSYDLVVWLYKELCAVSGIGIYSLKYNNHVGQQCLITDILLYIYKSSLLVGNI